MDVDQLKRECQFKASRSSGSGGQHVNKVATKVTLMFHVQRSETLTDAQKLRLVEVLKNRINKEGFLVLQSSETRSQARNKELAFLRFVNLLNSSLATQTDRIPTKVPKSVLKKRLKNKRFQAFKKQQRRKPDLE